MRISTFAATIADLCLVAGQASGAGAAVRPAAKAVKLEQMHYAAARKIILGYGWKPLSGDCEAKGAGTCTRFPEIGSCSAIDPGFCGMVFVQQSRCLYVVTTGGEPGGEGADARVKSVSFRRGPCAKT